MQEARPSGSLKGICLEIGDWLCSRTGKVRKRELDVHNLLKFRINDDIHAHRVSVEVIMCTVSCVY